VPEHDMRLTGEGIEGRRLLVVGATSGVGRALAEVAASRGARVVAVGRRKDRLETLSRESKTEIVPLVGDVRSEESCDRLVEDALSLLGGLDGLLYAAAVSPLGRLVDTTSTEWQAVLETNVIGAALVGRRCIPHLEASQGRALFISSISADDPRPMLVPYGASKAALNALIRGWRNEHPHLCFVRVVIGPTATEIGSGWDTARMTEFAAVRAERGLLRARIMTPAEVAHEVLATLVSPVWIEDLRLVPDNSDPGVTAQS
jgi:NAD(P)-dependent dehydrogenase (short-subunit alcohol dehydrogenase family)